MRCALCDLMLTVDEDGPFCGTCRDAEYECPICSTVATWTDGTVKALGDERDEFWCQACGHELPLEQCTPVHA